jgi:hypothetical protein
MSTRSKNDAAWTVFRAKVCSLVAVKVPRHYRIRAQVDDLAELVARCDGGVPPALFRSRRGQLLALLSIRVVRRQRQSRSLLVKSGKEAVVQSASEAEREAEAIVLIGSISTLFHPSIPHTPSHSKLAAPQP